MLSLVTALRFTAARSWLLVGAVCTHTSGTMGSTIAATRCGDVETYLEARIWLRASQTLPRLCLKSQLLAKLPMLCRTLYACVHQAYEVIHPRRNVSSRKA